MYYVYILYSKKLDTFYKGQTDSIEKRLERHNSGLNVSTKPGVPWQMLWTAEKSSRSDAIGLEQKLKNLNRERTLQFMLKYREGIFSDESRVLIEHMLLTKSPEGDLSGC